MNYINEMKSTVTTFEELPNNNLYRDCNTTSVTFGQLFLKCMGVGIQLTGKKIGWFHEFSSDFPVLKIDSDSLIR